MKITKSQLRRIIREEKARIVKESRIYSNPVDDIVENTLGYVSGGSFKSGMQILQYVRDAGQDYGLSAVEIDEALARIIDELMDDIRL